MQLFSTAVDDIAWGCSCLTDMGHLRLRSPQDLKCGASDLTLLSAVMRFATLANLVGLPAISLPVGQDSAGMGSRIPLGLLPRQTQQSRAACEATLVCAEAFPWVKPCHRTPVCVSGLPLLRAICFRSCSLHHALLGAGCERLVSIICIHCLLAAQRLPSCSWERLCSPRSIP